MAADTGTDSGAAGSPKASRGPLILALVNTLAILAAAGVFAYTRLVYNRPPITESAERKKLAEIREHPVAPTDTILLEFTPVTVNIESNPARPKPADGTPQQIKGKLHYVNIGFALELRDKKYQETVEKIRPVVLDAVLTLLGKKSLEELTTVQGRYVLKTQIIDEGNRLARMELQKKDAVFTSVYFTQFIVQ